MTSEQISEVLDNLLSNPKSKNFLTHLIKAYFPVSKIIRISEKPRGKFKCVLTKSNLISFNEILAEATSKAYKDNLKNFWEGMTKNYMDRDSPISDILINKNVGVTGSNTETYMSYGAYLEFFNWITLKILSGNKHINWVVKSMQASKDDLNPFAKYKESAPSSAMVSTFNIGDTDSFKKLKEKLELS